MWQILQNRVYMGATVGHKREVVELGGHRTRQVRQEEQIIVAGMHEAIVSEEEFEQAQLIIKRNGRGQAPRLSYPLKSLVFCANCGMRMTRLKKLGGFIAVMGIIMVKKDAAG